MEHTPTQQPPTVRRPYRTPRLRLLGDVKDITRDTGSFGFRADARDDPSLPEWLRVK
ncbi:MAG TPA: hypothetical protein VFU47_12735 [Armatimonadota bacterium]|nr:hypothetical protein [Armatimonadota bacterium]